jgi:hypothetical protein
MTVDQARLRDSRGPTRRCGAATIPHGSRKDETVDYHWKFTGTSRTTTTAK